MKLLTARLCNPILAPALALLLVVLCACDVSAASNSTLPCSSYSPVACLDYLKNCSISYSTVSSPKCTVGAPTDGCGGRVDANSCASNACFWDPYISRCFVTYSQTSSLFNCSLWSTTDEPNSFGSGACSFHGCIFDSTGTQCVPRTTSNTGVTNGGTTTAGSTANEAQWLATPAVLPDSLVFRTQVSMPIELKLSQPTNLVIGLGTAPREGLEALYGQASPCTTLSVSMNGERPGPVKYAPGENALKTYLIQWVQTQGNFNFDSSPEGIALRAYYGNVDIGPGSLVTRVMVSADQSRLIFECQPRSLPWIISTCGSRFSTAYGQNVDKTVAFYSAPFSLVLVSRSGGWSAVSTLYFINQQITGAVTISSSITYQVTLTVHETQSVVGACPRGQQAVSVILDIVYNNVYDPTIFVGPRTVTDIYPAGSSSSCYRDRVIGFQQMGCANQACTTRINMLSQCFNVPLTGTAFLNCSNVPDTTRIKDLGSVHTLYPDNWNRVHPFTIDAYECPLMSNGLGSIDSGCNQIHLPPAALDSASIIVNVYAFPMTFVDTPPIKIQFASLVSDQDRIDLSPSTFNSFVGSVNASNNPYSTALMNSLPSVAPMDRLALAIQIQDPILRKVYTAHLNLNALKIIPTDANGVVRSDLKPGTWRDIQAMSVYVPRAFRETTCPGCPLLPMCESSTACDGFSVWSGALTKLFPTAGGWFFYLPYNLSVAGQASTFTVQSHTPVGSTYDDMLPHRTMHQMALTLASGDHAFASLHTTFLSHGRHSALSSQPDQSPRKHVKVLARTSFTESDVVADVKNNETIGISTPQMSTDGSTAYSSSVLFFRAGWLTGATGPPACEGRFRCLSKLEQAGVICIPILSVLFLVALIMWRRTHRDYTAAMLKKQMSNVLPKILSGGKQRTATSTSTTMTGGSASAPSNVVAGSIVSHSTQRTKSVQIPSTPHAILGNQTPVVFHTSMNASATATTSKPLTVTTSPLSPASVQVRLTPSPTAIQHPRHERRMSSPIVLSPTSAPKSSSSNA